MSASDDIIAQLPIGEIAKRLGVDEKTARAAVNDAVPALLAGMGANAADPAGASSLEKAVARHSPALIDGGVALDEVDSADGEKIVKNVFGGSTDQVVKALDTKEGGPNVIGQLLPIVAPVVMSFLAGQFAKKQESPAAAASGGGFDLGGLVGGLLGGGGAGGSGGGLDLGGLLGGLLGGGKK